METSNNEVNPYIDNTVGALVWVRRRNGSWWPGRILAPEELPGAHLLSPRTGTPVKLLGREDGSVDWYNIEKSRRVKAFRCGEFDECIEKAMSLASVLSKKREKYARREDAILHALELEKELVQHTHLQAKMFSMGLNHEQLSDFVNGGKLLHSDMSASTFQRSFMGLDASTDVAEASSDSLFSLHGHRKFLDVEWEDDFTDSLPRMRGLQDLGLGIDPSKEEKECWNSAYQQFPNVSVTEDKKKAASCITKSTVDGMASNGIRMLKKKRSAQSNPMDDKSTHKKRHLQKAITAPFDNNGNLGDGAFELGSKVCFSPYTINASRNGYSPFLQHKQEKIADLLDKVPFESKPSKGWSASEGWEASLIESRCRNEMFSFLPFMDKACPSLADHQKPSCCSGRSYLYGGSQMEVASLVGSAFDSLLQGGSASRCSFSPRGAYAEPSTEVERVNSLSSTPPLSFQTWPSYNHTAEKLMHESGSRKQSASINPTYAPEYLYETSMYSAYSNRLIDNVISDKRRHYDAEGSLMSGNDLNVNTIKFSRHCLSPVAEEDAREGSFSEEDEADLFQQIPGSSLSSPEAIVISAANCQLKQEPLFEDESICSKVRMDFASENRILVDEGWDDESSICGAVDSGSLPEECDDMGYGHFLSKWQAKGRRTARVHCTTLWGLLPAGVPDGRLEENVEVHMAPNGVKGVGKRSRRPRRTFDLTSCSEGEEELLPAQLSGKVGADHATKANVYQVSSTYWVNVPIDFQDATFRPLVSIMSELIGKHIVGYSVLVENIANGFEGQVKGNALSRNSTTQSSLQPAWRTARRTAMQRIPRSRTIVVLDHTREAVCKQQPGNLCNGVMRKNEPQFGSSGVERRHQKKLSLLSQKTRMLSSISVHYSNKSLEPVCLKVSDAPLVTCIPVNVIFNRIREVLYSETSRAPSGCDNKS